MILLRFAGLGLVWIFTFRRVRGLLEIGVELVVAESLVPLPVL